jgi:hypothetical protein
MLAVSGGVAAEPPDRHRAGDARSAKAAASEQPLAGTSWSGTWSRHGRSATHPMQVVFDNDMAIFSVTTEQGRTHAFRAPYRITAQDRVRIEANALDRVDLYTIRRDSPMRMLGAYTYDGAPYGAVELRITGGAGDSERMAALEALARPDPTRTISFLSAEQTRQQVIGNTVIYRNNHAIHYAPDGTLTRTSPAGVRNGTWNMVNDRLCEQIGLSQLDGCYKLSIAQDGTLAYYKGVKVTRRGTIHAGQTNEIAGKQS